MRHPFSDLSQVAVSDLNQGCSVKRCHPDLSQVAIRNLNQDFFWGKY